jgi:hypothetical protein
VVAVALEGQDLHLAVLVAVKVIQLVQQEVQELLVKVMLEELLHLPLVVTMQVVVAAVRVVPV